ncbi:MAG TPA: F0F1 ATP synthase subunit delta [Legionella sp.]|nr:F0F1 ATP synthase subunit delta [Legionella sp.]
MSDNVTIARPYAKAIFNHALANKNLAHWSVVLQTLSQAVLDPNASQFICNPGSAPQLQTQLLLTVLETSNLTDDTSSTESLVRLLTANKRLLLLPTICAQFEMLRAEQEKTLTVQVSTFAALPDEQQQSLTQSLSQRLQRHVVLEVNIDPSLLGGAVIHAGDLVIDGSVRGKLTKLGTELAA